VTRQLTPVDALRRLEAARLEFGRGCGPAKLALLRPLVRGRLASARALLRLHEQLCFMRAFPDDHAILTAVEAMLCAFSRRGDLRRHRAALGDSGIAGTRIHYRFYWPTARRLAARWPGRLGIDWDALDEPGRFAVALPLLATPIEAAWLRVRDPSPRIALARLNRATEGEGTFLVRRIAAMPGDDFTREAFFDALDTPLFIDAGSNTLSRTLAWHARSPVAYVDSPLRRAAPDLHAELKRPPHRVRAASTGEGAQLIDLAQDALATRLRDIDGIAYGSARDVWVVDDAHGLQFAFIGVAPERRQLLRATYGFVTLRSGAPIGYGQLDTLFRCADVSFNSFTSFRGAETAWIFARLLAAGRALLGTCAFTLDGYQLGHQNDEAIASGAWWFYCKLGFRPSDPAIRKLADAELALIRANPKHRSSVAMLKRLSAGTMVFETEGARAPEWPRLADLGAPAARRLAAAAGPDRASAVQQYSRSAMKRLGVRSLAELGGSRSEVQRAWERWAPLVDQLPLTHWRREERAKLARIIAAKGGRSERDFLRQFDAHPRLARALLALTRA